MNKTQLIESIIANANISKPEATRALNALTESITQSLQNNEPVQLIGFGTFLVRERTARDGRNPATGEAIKIAAANIPAFRPGKALKDVVNS